MSQGERKLLDETGQFVQVVKDGRRHEEASWTDGRIIISNERLVLMEKDDAQEIELETVVELGGRYDVNQAVARVPEYTAVRFGERGRQVVLMTNEKDPEKIEHRMYKALLDRKTIYVRHPAVVGGVMQDTDWGKGQVKVEPKEVHVALPNGDVTTIELNDIAEFNTGEQEVFDEKRPVLKVEHTNEEGSSVQTHISGSDRHCAFLEALFREGEEQSEIGVELDYSEQKVLMALHSGISPFEIPEFVDMDIQTVEEIYDDLIELDVIEEDRVWKEVELTALGRKIASGAMEAE